MGVRGCCVFIFVVTATSLIGASNEKHAFLNEAKITLTFGFCKSIYHRLTITVLIVLKGLYVIIKNPFLYGFLHLEPDQNLGIY